MNSLNSIDIARILNDNNATTQYFKGVCPSDYMITSTSFPFCFVANVDKSNQPGTHWVAWFVDSEGVVSFFDSFGRSPRDTMWPKEFRNYVKNRRFRYNPRIIQSLYGVTCGHFCIFMLYFKSLGVDLKEIYDYFGEDKACRKKT